MAYCQQKNNRLTEWNGVYENLLTVLMSTTLILLLIAAEYFGLKYLKKRFDENKPS